MNITVSKENYLKAILFLKQKNGHVRATDVAASLSVKKPSVSIAFGKLAADGLILVHSNHEVDLTEAGYSIAAKISHSYETFRQFLCSIGVPEDVAELDACRVEHYLSPESILHITNLIAGREEPQAE